MTRIAIAAMAATLAGVWVAGSPATAQQKKASAACFSRCVNQQEGYWPKTCRGNAACSQRNCNAPDTYGSRPR
jgi:hypothetical protein